MEAITIYHNVRCGKSRGALEILEEKGIPFEVRFYMQQPLSVAELKALLKKLRLKAIDIVRKNEPVYKELFKDKIFSNEGWIKILAEHPVLLERPILEKGDLAIVARPPERVLELL